MRRGFRFRLAFGAVACAGVAFVPSSASAATINVPCGDVTALRAAITTANGTAAADTIDVTGAPCNFDVPNAAVVQASGDSGLPIIARPLTIEGHGATVRRTGATNYRLFAASTPDFVTIPRVELRELTIANGRLTAPNQSGGAVSGFLADVVLDRVVLSNNQATTRGGAVNVLGGSLDMDRTVALFNRAALGGAIATSTTGSSSDITRSSAYFNVATSNSGTMLVENGAAVLENSTVAANSAPGGLGGVTAFTSAAGTPASLTVRSTTLADNGLSGNTAPGTSLWAIATAGAATISATDTIVADTDSAAAPVSSPCLETGGGNIVSSGGNVEWPTTSCGFESEADPRLQYQFGGLAGAELFARLLPDSAAIDSGGNDCPAVDQRGEPRPAGLACDSGSYETQPPDTTAEGPASPTNDPLVTFTSSEPNSTFECRVDGGDWVACSSPFDPDPLDDGEHTVDVRAIDADGYPDPTPASVTFVVDRTPPEITIDPVASPTPDTTVEVTFSVSDASAIEGVTCQVDEEAPVDCTSPFTTEELGEGEHTVTVRATDAAGNTGSAAVTFVVDKAPETTTDSCHRSTLVLGSTCVVTFTCPEANSGCEASGRVEVKANRIIGVVHGDVQVATPASGPPERSDSAECGFPQRLTNRCSAETETIPVDPGETVRVGCSSARQVASVGVLVMELDCVGTFTKNVGPVG